MSKKRLNHDETDFATKSLICWGSPLASTQRPCASSNRRSCIFCHPMQRGLFFVVFVCGGLLPVALILFSNVYFDAKDCLRKVRNCWKAERTTIRHLNEHFVPDTNLPQTSPHLLLLPSSTYAFGRWYRGFGRRSLFFFGHGQLRTDISAVPNFCLVNISPFGARC